MSLLNGNNKKGGKGANKNTKNNAAATNKNVVKPGKSAGGFKQITRTGGTRGS